MNATESKTFSGKTDSLIRRRPGATISAGRLIKSLVSVLASVSLLVGGQAFAQDNLAGQSALNSKGASLQAPTDKPQPSAEELETKFKSSLTQATLTGRWCSIRKGELGPEKEDKYTIIGVTKLSGEHWAIHARIQYNKRDFTAPIPVRVRWAGDTPVLIVDKVPIPGGGVYSARVLIYDQTYAGTWTGGNYGGLIYGTITNEKENESSLSR